MCTTNTATTQTEKLLSGDLPEQIAAAELLATLGEAAQPAMVALVQHCGSSNEDLRNWCTAALESIGAPVAKQIDELTLLAGSANSDVAFWAITLLGRGGPLAASVLPILTERLNNISTPTVKKRLAWAIDQITG